jgi:hypothetical protein
MAINWYSCGVKILFFQFKMSRIKNKIIIIKLNNNGNNNSIYEIYYLFIYLFMCSPNFIGRKISHSRHILIVTSKIAFYVTHRCVYGVTVVKD